MTKVGGAGDGDGDGGRSKMTLGRRKLVMKRIEDANHLQVRFSKRKKGLFKKAQELAVRCGVQVLVVVFSPAGKPFSYGYPIVPLVVDRFLNPSAYEAEAAAAATLQVKAEFGELERQARVREEELRWRTDLGLGKALSADGGWIDGDLQSMDLPHLEALLAGLERVQAEAAERAHEMIVAEQAMTMQCAGGSLLRCYGSGAGSHEVMGGGAGSTFDCFGFGSFTANGGGSHEVAMDTTTSMKLQTMSSGAGSLFHYLGPSPFTVDGASTSHQGTAMDTTTMKLQVSSAGAGKNLFHYLGPAGGPFTASHDGIAMDSTLTSMGGNVCHALAPVIPPGPPLALPFNQGDGGDNHGHGYYNQGQGDGDGDGDYYHGHGHADGLYEMEGVYAKTCNFFG